MSLRDISTRLAANALTASPDPVHGSLTAAWRTSNAKIFIGWMSLIVSDIDCSNVYIAWRQNACVISVRRSTNGQHTRLQRRHSFLL